MVVPDGWIYFPPPLILNVEIVGAVVPVTVEPLAIVAVLNVVALDPASDCEAPLNVTVPALAVNVPFFVKLPFTERAKLDAVASRVPDEIRRFPFNAVATPKFTIWATAVMVRLLYVAMAAGNVEPPPVTFQLIVPAPGVNVWLAVVQEVVICSVPPLMLVAP